MLRVPIAQSVLNTSNNNAHNTHALLLAVGLCISIRDALQAAVVCCSSVCAEIAHQKKRLVAECKAW
jgi:hypothetical protein